MLERVLALLVMPAPRVRIPLLLKHSYLLLVSIGCGTYFAREYPKMLMAAGMDEYLVAVNGKGSYAVGGSAVAKAILEDLERLNLISSFKDDGEGNYRVHAKRKKE